MVRTLASVLCVLGFFSAFARQTVTGVVKEKDVPLEFANVLMMARSDSTTVLAGTLTDAAGQFALHNVAPGDYTLRVQLIGYVATQIDVAVGESDVRLAPVALEPDTRLLNAVEVNALRHLITKTEEGIVVNAGDNLTQVGGTAADLLRNMPGVLVSPEGEISLRGKTPLTLVNGRISGITGADRAGQLERIAASSIERIEIINNPSARYSADAEGGIINIILKKSEDAGTNGAAAVGAGLGARYRLNASFLLNKNTGKWNVGLAYDNWYTTRTRRVRGDRINFDLPDSYYLTQRRFDERLILYQNARATVDYHPTEKSSFSLEALWAFPGEDNNETLNNTFQTQERGFTGANQRHSNEIRRSHGFELAMNYSRSFEDPDRKLSAGISSSLEDNRENTDITTRQRMEQGELVGNQALQRTHTYEWGGVSNAHVDFSAPLAASALIETGYLGTLRMLNVDFERASEMGGQFVADPLNTGIFDFREQIHAAYAQYTEWSGTRQQPVWKYNAGLRAEQVWNRGETLNDPDAVENRYFNLFPSANLYFYTQARNNLKLSYSRRINRPGLGQLNPFTDITDSLNQRSGNPNLRPELIHSLEAGYTHALEKASLSFTAFYRLRSRAIFPWTVLDANGVAFTQLQNFGNATTYGFEGIGSAYPADFWTVNLSISAYQLFIDEEDFEDIATGRLSWYTKLINNFSPGKNSTLQLIANYTSPIAIPQGETVAVYHVDLGFQQKLLKGQGRLGIVFTDVFDTQQYGMITADENFDFSRIFKLDTRAVMCTFGYTFGAAFREKLMENRFKNE